MKETRTLMGMPITLEIRDTREKETKESIDRVFSYFAYVDEVFSVYKENSEISRINKGELGWNDISADMKTVFRLAEETNKETSGYFNILTPQGFLDPSGLVKGWAIHHAAFMLEGEGFVDFYVEAGGDVQVKRPESSIDSWSLGIRNPFNREQVVKVLSIRNEGVATSGTYIRGQHIYNPHNPLQIFENVVSITVVGPNIYEADRFATAAFAMGGSGIEFIEQMPGLEGYQIDKNGVALQTSGFAKYVK